MLDTHRFTPSRPDGVVCVAYRRAEPLDSMREVCGYPAGHPIHEADAAPVSLAERFEETRARAVDRDGAKADVEWLKHKIMSLEGSAPMLAALERIERAL